MENTELVVKKEEKVIVTKQICDDFLFTAGTKLNEQQKLMFYNLALQFNLNPFKREIHAIPYGAGWNFVTGYQVYIARADSTGLLNGWSTENIYDNANKLMGARITIYRKDWAEPFIWEVSLAEFIKDTTIWKKMTEFMIKKIAIGQGFRLAFPNELGDMPYLKEELEGLMPEREAINPPQSKPEVKPETLQTAPAETETIITGIENITEAHGTKNNKTWTKYTIHADKEYNTFSKTLADDAKKAAEAGLQVAIESKKTAYGYDVVALKIQEPENREPGVEG